MLNIGICTANVDLKKTIIYELNEFQSFHETRFSVSNISSEKNIVAEILENNVKVVFLDDLMSEDVAYELINKKELLYVILITDSIEKKKKSAESKMLDIISKSRIDAEICSVLKKAMKTISEENYILESMKGGLVNKLYVKDIEYIDIVKHYINFYWKDDTYKKRGSINEYEDKLDSDGFIKINRGTLVNIRFIKEILKCTLVLLDGRKLVISRDRAEQVSLCFSRWNEIFCEGNRI